MHILVVEDDAQERYWLGTKLRSCGHMCRLVAEKGCALRSLKEEAFDVVVLDRILSGTSTLDVLADLKARPHPPVLMLSALDSPEARVDGLRAGADDYLGKPCHFHELLVRLENLARRPGYGDRDDKRLVVDDLVMDTVSRDIRRGGVRIDLTDKEFKLLHVLMQNKGQNVTRSMLIEKVWGLQFFPQTNLIDVHISKLRTKIDKDQSYPLLRTVRSVGYALG